MLAEGGGDMRWRSWISQYDIPVQQWVLLSAGQIRILAAGRYYLGRIVPAGSAVVRMIAGDHAASRRFRSTQRLLSNLYMERFVPAGESHVFYVTDDWPGTELSQDVADVEAAVDNLLRLHGALDGLGDAWDARLRAWGVAPPPARYGAWERGFTQGARAFAAERLLADPRCSNNERLWQDWLGRWEELAYMAAERLHQAGYKALSEQAAAAKQYAWGGYGLRHVRRLASGKLMTLQTSDPIPDVEWLDLATLCHELCVKGRADGVTAAIRRYRVGRRLPPEAQQAVMAFAVFPHEPLRRLERARADGVRPQMDPAEVRQAQCHLAAAKALLF